MSNINDEAFFRLVDSVGNTARALLLQVERQGGISNALARGHKETMLQQIVEMNSCLRTLERRLTQTPGAYSQQGDISTASDFERAHTKRCVVF